jgi:hypothetical protein
MREEMLKSVLSDLNGSSADIEASAVISTVCRHRGLSRDFYRRPHYRLTAFFDHG